ncbi:MAG: Fe2+-dependent dioxygenase [Pseudomonadota bacterium]
MILKIAAISDRAELAKIGGLLKSLNWRDGRATAGSVAKAVKQNEQAVMKEAAGQAVRDAILPHIVGNTVLRSAARPKKFSHLMVSRTQDGGFYGAHIDNALMGDGRAKMRSDLSFTLFLSEPDEYEGGELTVHSAGASQSIKAAAGHLVLYPSSSIHEVTPVTSGRRIVCVGWIESLIADPFQREILFDLDNTRAALRSISNSDPQAMLMLDKSISNLLRMWSRP